MKVSAERADYLTTKYVWAIQNEGNWHAKCCDAPRLNDYSMFRRVTSTYMSTLQNKISREEPEAKLGTSDRTFIRLALWEGLGGRMSDVDNDDKFILSEGTKDERPANLFAVYGEAYTLRNPGVRTGKRWLPEENVLLVDLLKRRFPLERIAEIMQRTGLAICERGVALGHLKENDQGNFEFTDLCLPRSETIVSEVEQHITNTQCHYDHTRNPGWALPEFEFNQLETKENTMTVQTNPNTAFETKTIIFGREASALSEQDLIDAIKRIEGEISKLKEVKTESKKIKSNIAELEANLAKIVEVLDAR